MGNFIHGSLLDAAPSKTLKLHTPPSSVALTVYRRRLRVEWAAYQAELAKAETQAQRQTARRAYDDAVATETKAYRRHVV
jgi:hypothetical protein